MREAKVILYPIFGVFQFYLAAQHSTSFGLAVIQIVCGTALIGLGVLNLRKLLAAHESDNVIKGNK